MDSWVYAMLPDARWMGDVCSPPMKERICEDGLCDAGKSQQNQQLPCGSGAGVFN